MQALYQLSYTPIKVLRVRLGLAKALATIAILPLTTLNQEIDSLKALEDIALLGNGARPFKAGMLTHLLKNSNLSNAVYTIKWFRSWQAKSSGRSKKFIRLVPTPCYSWRKASIGSSRDARKAG